MFPTLVLDDMLFAECHVGRICRAFCTTRQDWLLVRIQEQLKNGLISFEVLHDGTVLQAGPETCEKLRQAEYDKFGCAASMLSVSYYFFCFAGYFFACHVSYPRHLVCICAKGCNKKRFVRKTEHLA